jgi:hypothetical protein
MAKKIILLSDGTGNSAGKVWRTNVWRVFQALELKGSNQIAIYDDGVGTSSFKPLAILGGVFGYGLKRNVLNLYKFLCRNYQTGDKIYGFGFSRGAFTMRIVMGLVLNQGLVKFANEAERRLSRLSPRQISRLESAVSVPAGPVLAGQAFLYLMRAAGRCNRICGRMGHGCRLWIANR